MTSANDKATHANKDRSFSLKLVIVCFCVAVGIALLAWIVLSKADHPVKSANAKKERRIQQVDAKIKKKPFERKKWRPDKEVKLTANVTPPVRMTKDVVEIGGLPTNCILSKVRFKRDSDNLIAGLIVAVPGDHFLSSRHWDRFFDEEFKESLNEEIEFSDGDSEEDRMVKEAVAATRKMLAENMANGWKPSEIMAEAQKELEKITAYRDQLNEIMNEYLDKGDLPGALKFKDEANDLLGEYNARPLTIGNKKMQHIQARLQEQ